MKYYFLASGSAGNATALVNDNNEIITTVRERIMQRSKLVDNLHILVNPMYKEHNMSDFTVMMEYMLPVSKEYCSEILVKSLVNFRVQIEPIQVSSQGII